MRTRNRLTDTIRGVASTIALAVLVIGPPVALAGFAPNPIPRNVPQLADITDAFTRTGVSDQTIIAVLTALAWILWLQRARLSDSALAEMDVDK